MEEKRKKPNKLLRHERELRGWSQRAIANMINTTEQVVNRWESGEHKPNRYFQTQLCKIFGKNAEELGFMDESLWMKENTESSALSFSTLSPSFHVELPTTMVPVPDVSLSNLSFPEMASDMFNIGIKALALARQQNGWTLSDLSHRAIQALRESQIERHNKNISRRQALDFLASFPLTITGISTQTKNLLAYPLAQEEILPLYITGISACWELYSHGHLAEIEQILPSYLANLTYLVQQHSKHYHTTVLFASQMYQLAALVAKHREDFGAALAYCKQALLYGQEADDPNLIVSSFIRQGDVLFYRKRFFQAIEVLQQAEHYALRVTPLLRSRIYSELAPSYARFGDLQMALRYMGQAHNTMPTQPEEDLNYFFTRSNQYMLHLNDTLLFLYTKRPKDALDAIAKATPFVPSVVNTQHIEVLSYKTICSIELNDMERSIESFQTLAKATGALGSDLFKVNVMRSIRR